MTNTNLVGIITVGGLPQFIAGASLVDGTATEVKYTPDAGTAESVGKRFDGKKMSRVELQVADGSIASLVEILDEKGAVIWSSGGRERSGEQLLDFDSGPLDIILRLGYKLRVTTAD